MAENKVLVLQALLERLQMANEHYSGNWFGHVLWVLERNPDDYPIPVPHPDDPELRSLVWQESFGRFIRLCGEAELLARTAGRVADRQMDLVVRLTRWPHANSPEVSLAKFCASFDEQVSRAVGTVGDYLAERPGVIDPISSEAIAEALARVTEIRGLLEGVELPVELTEMLHRAVDDLVESLHFASTWGAGPVNDRVAVLSTTLVAVGSAQPDGSIPNRKIGAAIAVALGLVIGVPGAVNDSLALIDRWFPHEIGAPVPPASRADDAIDAELVLDDLPAEPVPGQ